MPSNQFSAFHLHQVRLAQILGKTWDRCYSVQIPTYGGVLSHETEFNEFEQALSTDLSPSTVQDSHTAMLQFQVRMLMALLAFLLIILHLQKQTMMLQVFHVHFLLMVRSFISQYNMTYSFKRHFFFKAIPTETGSGEQNDSNQVQVQLFHRYASQVTISYWYGSRLFNYEAAANISSLVERL